MEERYRNSFKYFENHQCRYYPCHDMEHINCLFCYCPLYFLSSCPGNFTWVTSKDGRKIKSCMDCSWPHKAESYGEIVKILTKGSE
ncbi:MAG: metal-binding protein [Lachnospiraceae bacterium]|uniref:Metal-binding protein n=1 Tax=Candidatus Weimeria bifida TaxID=2599074 RepID=A0A6N7IX38_9FIRM|nr:metal-binding protein [Candidatus Weimeria bifida]RRF97223.1 MAG: metal-binding protein [Lachnospiraceae bacterium]